MTSSQCTPLVIAGTHSGVGKTSITLGLLRACARRGHPRQPAKIGPDYLDPIHLSQAARTPCINLDPWMMGDDYVHSQASSSALPLMIEGVMGMYDGPAPDHHKGSTAHLAQIVHGQVILIVDASGAARSFAATVWGFCQFPDAPPIAGVIANRVGSTGHTSLLKEALASINGPPLLGGIPAGALPTIPERHLGLIADHPEDSLYEQLADAVESHLNLDLLLNPPSLPTIPSPSTSLSTDLRLGVAADAAFSFIYEDDRQALTASGIELISFSPLHDASLPLQLDGLFIPGGYPELHAKMLAANTTMLEAIRNFPGPIYAECGGLMYLTQGFEDDQNHFHKWVGLVPCRCALTPSRMRLGYVETTLTTSCLLGHPGETLRGHEFHYGTLIGDPCQDDRWQHAYRVQNRRGTEAWAGYTDGRVLASWVHHHLASRPSALAAIRTALGSKTQV